MGEWIAEHDIPVKFDAPWQGGHKWILKECLNGHTDNAGYLTQMPSGAKVARCHHNSCTYEWPDYYEHFDPDAYSRNGFRAKGDGNDSNDSDFKGFAGVLADMPEPVEFPTDTMLESVRPFIRETAASIGCPVDFVGLSALVALAATMGDTRRIVIKREWLESATLFGMNIGEPGSKKTPAMNAAFRPVREKQMKYKSEYERQKEEYKSQLVNYQKTVKEGPTELSEPDKPTLRRTYGDDTTVERLADVLNENPRGVVIIKDELSGWLGSMNQYKAGGKGSDRQFWLSVHTNQPVSVDRKSLEEPVIVPRPWASVCGGIQPGVLPDFGKDRGDRLMDRFLPVYPNPPAGSWKDDEVSEEARTAYDEIISDLYRLEHAEGDDGPFPSRVNMTDDAKALFIQEYNGLHAEMNDLGFPSRLQPAWSKLEAYFAWIALILAVTRHVENPTAHMFEVVAKQDVANAAKLLAYFKNHVRWVYTGLYGDNPDDLLAADIRSFLVTLNNASWEGTASELFAALDSDHKPERPVDLAKIVRGLAKRSSTLTWTDLKRTKHRRPFRLSLRNTVIAVTPEGEEHQNATETLQSAESNGTSDTSGPSPNGKVIASEEEVFELVRSEPLLDDEGEL
jgi:hypothetical protein